MVGINKKDGGFKCDAISNLALHFIPLLTNKRIDQNDLTRLDNIFQRLSHEPLDELKSSLADQRSIWNYCLKFGQNFSK